MLLSIDQINLAGILVNDTSHILNHRAFLQKVDNINKGISMANIIVYPPMNGKYTIADGIHRLFAYLHKNITVFECTVEPDTEYIGKDYDLDDDLIHLLESSDFDIDDEKDSRDELIDNMEDDDTFDIGEDYDLEDEEDTFDRELWKD